MDFLPGWNVQIRTWSDAQSVFKLGIFLIVSKRSGIGFFRLF